jgi:hypothetical protein
VTAENCLLVIALFNASVSDIAFFTAPGPSADKSRILRVLAASYLDFYHKPVKTARCKHILS